jgi:hypothetical protein
VYSSSHSIEAAELSSSLRHELSKLQADMASIKAIIVAASSNASGTALTPPHVGSQAPEGELLTWIRNQKSGPGVDKWIPYLEAYEKHFGPYRALGKIHMVEVGVQSGGSIDMWRAFFGPDRLM